MMTSHDCFEIASLPCNHQLYKKNIRILASKILDDLSPEAEIKLQTQDTLAFTSMITNKFDDDTYTFHLFAKEIEWQDMKRLDFNVEDVEEQ